MGDPSAGGSSTSATRPSPSSPRSAKGSARSASPGSPLSRSAVRELADRHGIRPTKALGQHFLADPNLARAIVADAGVGPGDRVVDVGAGVGSLTVALAAAGCEVVAVELDRAILPALREVVAPWSNVRVVEADALRTDWAELLGPRRWSLVANLPYNISVPLTVDLLDRAPAIDPLVVMVQREVGDRLLASPGDEAYGPLGLRVAYHADARLDRRVPADVFWPRPKVDSVIARLTRREPPVDVDPVALFRVVDVAFAERRKTMVNALRRLGLDLDDATRLCRVSEVEPSDRPERIDLVGFARITTALIAQGWRP